MFERLRDLACWTLLIRQYGYTMMTVRGYHLDAYENGAVWFVLRAEALSLGE